MDRSVFLRQCLQQTDNALPSEGIDKHKKMATSPFVFFRGSAPLFYADIQAGTLTLPAPLNTLPLTTIMGDCHAANFGFLTEEGAHGDTVIFSPNDFDDACLGHASWDLARFITSLFLTQHHCQGVKAAEIGAEKDYSSKPVVSSAAATAAASAFLTRYLETCQQCLASPQTRYQALTEFDEQHLLHKHLVKAQSRAANGATFYSKSALAKAVDLTDEGICFAHLPEKFERLTDDEYQAIHTKFRPYVDDHIHDIVARLNAGTGSVNMGRYYLLVGPQEAAQSHLSLCHIVEVKQQRHAAPLAYFPKLSPINQLNAAHLTVNCQRRMQRSPDLVLDEVEWRGQHWLVRSRHHAKVGIKPEHIGLGKKAVHKHGFSQYAQACGQSLALAHCRGDRRSTLFEQAVVEVLPSAQGELIDVCQRYAQQVQADTKALETMLAG
ncbi:DUF2252 domain-containing protein [Thalassotalea euphylliae]|uniref:DUF2252 domain-containing protein n=1 Tax=Thalassotalea euphylliae TaxID=1655234 RepID=A0A3E0TNT0_9GAMM|nr:DUF2252 family protein [Thalassotalea euphylliae]REL26271.1 DUF2252 domain-containing protein [Thalassotalea euphylliae]